MGIRMISLKRGLATLVIWALVMPVGFAQTGPLERIDGFQRAYAGSFFVFDACADALAGRNFRAALVERFGQCPFSDAARGRFRQWSAAQRRKSGDMIERLVEDNGGLPVRVEGMSQTCHERNAGAEYVAFRARLMLYGQKQVPAGEVAAEPCVPAAE
jgi:hypothetical protein